MPRPAPRRLARLLALLLLTHAPLASRAAELATLNDENFDRLCAPGGEADAVLDDFAMQNDRVSLAIGNPELLGGRSTSRSSGMWFEGCIIDMTPRDGRKPGNDRLTWFAPGPRMSPHQPDSVTGRALYKPGYAADFKTVTGKSVKLDLDDTTWLGREIPSTIHYTLEDGKRYVTSEVIYINPLTRPEAKRLIPVRKQPETTAEVLQEAVAEPRGVGVDKGLVTMPDDPVPPPPLGPISATPGWSLFVDGVADKGFDPDQSLTWYHDRWYGQAYAVLEEKEWTFDSADGKSERIRPRGVPILLQPGEKLHVVRRLFVGADLFEVRRDVNEFLGLKHRKVTVRVADSRGPVVDADVAAAGATHPDATVLRYGAGRTDEKGEITCWLPPGRFELIVASIGRSATLAVPLDADASLTAELPPAASIDIQITDDKGGPIPCKVELRGRDGTPDPYLFPEIGDRLVRNLIYTTDGKARQVIPPGKYLAIVTRGPEYDAVTQPLDIAPGTDATLRAKLTRVVDTAGWVSVDLHGYSTLSNRPAMSAYSVASTLGRVLNLLAEDIRFSPATELNKAYNYQPIIDSLGAAKWLASCGGIALTDNGRKYAFNDQYAFPIEYHPRQHDGGVPQRPQHCGQIEWLMSWGYPIDPENPWAAARHRGYEKCLILMQPDNNAPPDEKVHDPHTNSTFHDRDVPFFWADISALIRPMFRDTDDDGLPDRVHHNFAAQMDALEVRTLAPLIDPKAHVENDILHWLLMRANGYRMTGVVSSHATDNFHGSGGVRTYVRCDTPVEKIDPLTIGREIRAGHAIMTTGPFVQITATSDKKTAIPGDTLAATADAVTLNLRAQAPNWITLDRAEFWINGKVDPALTLDREKQPDAFKPGPVQIERSFQLKIPKDTQVIAIVYGRGPNYRKRKPDAPDTARHVAVTNPILIDKNGDGFVPPSPVGETIQVEPTLRKPVLSKKGAPPGKVRLVITNHGKGPAQGVATLEFRPAGVVEPVTKPDLAFNLEPGQSKTVEFNLKLTHDAETDAMIGGAEKPKTTLHILRSTTAPQIASGKIPIIIDNGAAIMDETDVP